MSLVPISEGAKLVGKDRKTLYRDIKKGRLSATVGDSGMSQVETSELLRFYGAFRGIGDKIATGVTVAMPQRETANSTDLLVLKSENASLRERLLEKDRYLEDMRNAMRLLEHARRSWWRLW
jgi:hypothetical protein